MGNVLCVLCDTSADKAREGNREDVSLITGPAHEVSHQPPDDEAAKVVASQAPAKGGGAGTSHHVVIEAGSGGEPHDDDHPKKGSKGVKLVFEDIQADEGYDEREARAESSAKKAAFQSAASSTATRSFMGKCPTFIDPHKGLRTGKTVMLSSGHVLDAYETLGKLGEGGFGCVYKVRHKVDNKLYALKSIPVDNVNDPEAFERELDISKKLNHPYIIRLHQTFNDPEAYHLIMDLCTGGDFHEHILSTVVSFAGQTYGGLKTADVGRTMWMILNGVAYMHNYRFAHRDIKPENYLLPEKDSKSGVKLIDFGLGRSFKKGEKMISKVGTVAYVAPEVMSSEDGYDEKCDIWSIGVLCYVMASAEMPFLGHNDAETLAQIRLGKVSFDGQDWARQADDVKKLVMELLMMDPAKRPSAKDLLMTNPFIMKHAAGANANKDSCCAMS